VHRGWLACYASETLSRTVSRVFAFAMPVYSVPFQPSLSSNHAHEPTFSHSFSTPSGVVGPRGMEILLPVDPERFGDMHSHLLSRLPAPSSDEKVKALLRL